MRTSEQIRMPFGKFRGCDLNDPEQVPDYYVKWLHEDPPFRLHPWLRAAIADEYMRRGLDSDQPQRRIEQVLELEIPAQLVPLAVEAFELGHKQLAKRLHPDAGGDGATMTLLNRLRDDLRRQLRGGVDHERP